jgi:hypothetical protein
MFLGKSFLYRGSFKTSVLKEQPLKKAVLSNQRFAAIDRKTARASAKLTEFCKKLIIPTKAIYFYCF